MNIVNGLRGGLSIVKTLIVTGHIHDRMSLFRKQRLRSSVSSLFVVKDSTALQGIHPSHSSHSLGNLDTNDSDEDPEEKSYLNISTIPHEGFAKNEEWVG